MLPLILLAAAATSTAAASGDCCPLALVAYYFTAESNLNFIASLFTLPDYAALLPYKPNITDPNYIVTGARVSVPFRCSCLHLLLRVDLPDRQLLVRAATRGCRLGTGCSSPTRFGKGR
ncbi:unnamed protein product [Urochloa humidicola]